MIQNYPLPEWLAWMEPLSVPFLVLAAIGAVLWEIKRDRARRDAADAEVSAHAYALRRQMREWLVDDWPETPEAMVAKANRLTKKEPLDRAESRSLRIVTAARAASAGIADAARRQYVLFYRATLYLNRASEVKAPRARYDPSTGTAEPGTEEEWSELVRDDGREWIRHLVQECLTALTDAIEEDLTNAEHTLLGPAQGGATETG